MNPLTGLINQLRRFPGIGQKSAERLAFYLISLSKTEVDSIAETMKTTKHNIQYCQTCFNLSFDSLCFICKDSTRDQKTCCIVAEPKDIYAIERAQAYKGTYHVLGGLISPLDNITPESLRISELLKRLNQTPFSEIIFAINPSVEGDTTTLYLSSLIEKYNIKHTKLAHGLPMGANIDYTDEMTLKQAITGRTTVTT